jgi:hypothetical protein
MYNYILGGFPDFTLPTPLMNITGNLLDHHHCKIIVALDTENIITLTSTGQRIYTENIITLTSTGQRIYTENIITLTSTGQRIYPLDLGLWIQRTSSH